jgi:hypothetical protein
MANKTNKKIQPVKNLDDLKTTNSLAGAADALLITQDWQKKYGLGGNSSGTYCKRARTHNYEI